MKTYFIWAFVFLVVYGAAALFGSVFLVGEIVRFSPGCGDERCVEFTYGVNWSQVFIYGLLVALIFAFAILMYRLRKSLFHLEQKEREVVELAKNGLR